MHYINIYELADVIEVSIDYNHVSRVIIVPSEIDEVSIDYNHVIKDETNTNKVKKFKKSIIIKASVCCDNRPELFSELIQVFKGLSLTTVKAKQT